VQQHGDDLHRLISALGGGAVEVFASSGGAVKGVGAESEAEMATVPGAAVADRLDTKAMQS
jgi:hypothetical protein